MTEQKASAPQPKPADNPIMVFRGQMDRFSSEIGAALPAHIPVERFMRVVLTAVNFDPDLLAADRQSLFEAALKAAQDGLLPDKREGAFVIYNTKVKRNGVERWINKVQWMPMVGGILKKVRNSGQLSSIVARVVYAGDKYRYWIDEKGEHIEYEPADDPDTNIVRAVFALALTKDGAAYIEPMTPRQIEKVRQASKSKDKGPWVSWWDEMAQKTAIRRLSKRLPMSSDLDDLVRRDDELYDFDDKRPAVSSLAGEMFGFVKDPLNDDLNDGGDGADERTPQDGSDQKPADSKPEPQESAATSSAEPGEKPSEREPDGQSRRAPLEGGDGGPPPSAKQSAAPSSSLFKE